MTGKPSLRLGAGLGEPGRAVSLARPWPALRAGALAAGIGLGLLTLLAAGLRFWRLDAIPPGFHYDEALEALEAWRVLTVPGYHPIYFPGDFGLAPIFIYLSSLAFRFSAPSPALSRSIAAAVGTLTVPAVYALGRELILLDGSLPEAMPLLAAGVLAVLRWHVTFSRVAIEPILVPLFLVVVLWALLRALRTNRLPVWLALGLALGLSVYSYPAAWLLPPLVVAILLYLALSGKTRLSSRWRGLACAALLAAFLALPLVLNLVGDSGRLLMRTEQVAVTGAAGVARGVLAEVGSNLVKVLGMFSFAGDADPRSNIPGVPALDPLLSIPFYLAVILVVWRWKRPASAVLLLGACAMLANTIFSQYAPHFRRAIGLTPLIALLCGLGLGAILEPGRLGVVRRVQAGWARRLPVRESPPGGTGVGRAARLIGVLVVGLLLLGSGFLNLRAYFVQWARSPDLFAAYDEGLWEIGTYVKSLPPGDDILITPRPAGDATLAFAWREGPSVRHFDGRNAMILPGDGRPATYIVIEHEDFRATRLLRELYPDAEEIKTFMDRSGQVYARALRVSAGSPLVRRPQTPVDYRWAGIQLIGYDLDKSVYHAGDIIYLQFWWRATAPLADDWTVFTHLLGAERADGSILWAGKDARPGQGSALTTTWQPGDTILDEYQIRLGQDLPPGEYQLEIGLYNQAAGGKRAPALKPAGQDHVILTQVEVK